MHWVDVSCARCVQELLQWVATHCPSPPPRCRRMSGTKRTWLAGAGVPGELEVVGGLQLPFGAVQVGVTLNSGDGRGLARDRAEHLMTQANPAGQRVRNGRHWPASRDQ